MALQLVSNLIANTVSALTAASTQNVMDAAGESTAIIGQLYLQGGSGSKTLSAAGGGSIVWRTGASVTFNNGSTLIDCGVQDVSATTGLEDGTFDVKGTMTSGSGVAANAYFYVTMASGSKTMAHGDTIAIVLEMTARGGADSVTAARFLPANSVGASAFPYGTADTGTLTKTVNYPFLMIIFDDGTVGWIDGMSALAVTRTSTSFNSGSTPDEYCGCFTPTIKMEINAIGIDVSDIDAGDDFEVILYQDPQGTPTVLQTATVDPDVTNQAGQGYAFSIFNITATTLSPGTQYGIALRPTTTNPISIGYVDYIQAAGEALKNMSPWFGTTAILASRTNQTGAFSTVQTYYLPLIWMHVSKLDDGASSGGGGGNTVFGGLGGVVI